MKVCCLALKKSRLVHCLVINLCVLSIFLTLGTSMAQEPKRVPSKELIEQISPQIKESLRKFFNDTSVSSKQLSRETMLIVPQSAYQVPVAVIDEQGKLQVIEIGRSSLK